MGHNFTVLKGKPYPLGMSVTGEGELNFAAALPRNEECSLILYPKNGGKQIRLPFQEENRTGNIYCMKLKGITASAYEYNFCTGEELVTDPYAKKVTGNERWGQKVSPILRGADQTEIFDWGEDAHPATPLCDSILYLLHVRGFTKHASSGVAHKGTFAGIIEKIPYLKELGITAVELMPAYEFVELAPEREKTEGLSMTEAVRRCTQKKSEQEEPRINYWGFKKGYYFSPKASYSSSTDAAAEFKTMVKQLHENGIEVIMQFYFPKEIQADYMLEVLRHWVYEYHVDGIHLFGGQIPAAIIAADPMLSDTKLFYYDFPCGEIFPNTEIPTVKNLACYRDDFLHDMRHFLKGDEDMVSRALYQLKKNPQQTGAVNYISNYEGFSLADLVSFDARHNEENGEDNRDGSVDNVSWNCGAEGKTRKKNVLTLRTRQIKNAMLMLFFAQGTPMLVSGDEFGHSKGGNNNSWCQDNAISWLNWKQTQTNRELLDFVREAIALRKEHPILHRPDELTMMDFIACGYPDLSYHGKEAWRLSGERISREVGILYCGCYAKVDRIRDDDFFYIAYNMHWEKKELALPDLPAGMHWETVMDTYGTVEKKAVPQTADDTVAKEDAETDSCVEQKAVLLPGRSIRILKSFGEPIKKGK